MPLTTYIQNANQYFLKRFLNIKHSLGCWVSCHCQSEWLCRRERNTEDKETFHNKSEQATENKNGKIKICYGVKSQAKFAPGLRRWGKNVVHCNTFAIRTFWRKLVTRLSLSYSLTDSVIVQHYYMISIFSVYMSSLIHSISALPFLAAFSLFSVIVYFFTQYAAIKNCRLSGHAIDSFKSPWKSSEWTLRKFSWGHKSRLVVTARFSFWVNKFPPRRWVGNR